MGGAESREASPGEQRYFAEEHLKQVIEAAQGQYRVLFAVLAGTAMRIGEAAGLNVEGVDIHSQVVHVRRGIWKGQDLAPKTENVRSGRSTSMRRLTEMLRLFIGKRKAGRLFQAARDAPSVTATSASACSTRYSNGWGFPELGCTRSGIHV